jgi:hypothetical protein
MKKTTLVKRSPTLILLSLLAYACYAVTASMTDLAPARNEIKNGLDVMVKDVVSASKDEVRGLTRVVLRDPFRVVSKPSAVPKPADASEDSGPDSLAGVVNGLSLDATFLQGKTRIAIISGRMYHQGQHLVIAGDAGKANSPLFVQNVRVQSVTLEARGRMYELAYPDQLGNRPAAGKGHGGNPVDGTMAEVDPEGQLAFYKRLLNSPLGKMGKSLTGNMGLGAPNQGRGASRPGRARGTRGSGSSGSTP